MKTYKDLYPLIYDYENLYTAYLEARMNKRYKAEVLRFTANLEENLIDIQNALIWHTYKLGKFHEFYVTEPKKRLIMALPFRDRVVQCALHQIVFPIYLKGFITDSYGSIPGRGPLKAADRIRYWLRAVNGKPKDWYILKADISKFFFRIPKSVQMRELSRPIADKRVIWLYNKIINGTDTAFGLPLDAVNYDVDLRLHDIGMPVGSLISQLTANVVLNRLDQYMKRDIKIHYYARYMDDIIVLAESKDSAHHYRMLMEDFLNEELGLNLNKKTAVFPARLGVEFVGYHITDEGLKLRKSSALRMKRRLTYVKNQYSRGEIDLDYAESLIQNYLGIMQHCDCDALRKKVLQDFTLIRNSGSGEDIPDDWPETDKDYLNSLILMSP